MGIKIKVQGVPYYVCSPATADGSRISVPVLPEKYTDWNDTLSKYLLKDQYEGAEGNVR